MVEGVKPGRVYYVIAALILLFGFVSSGWLLYNTITGSTESQRWLIPGTTEVNLAQTGNYTIYHEYRSFFDGKLYETMGNLQGLTCTVANVETGEQITVGPSQYSARYTYGSQSGYSIFSFNITKPGNYKISAEYPKNQGGPQAVLAVSQGMLGNLFVGIAGMIGLLLGSIFLFTIIIVVTKMKRRQFMNNLNSPPIQ